MVSAEYCVQELVFKSQPTTHCGAMGKSPHPWLGFAGCVTVVWFDLVLCPRVCHALAIGSRGLIIFKFDVWGQVCSVVLCFHHKVYNVSPSHSVGGGGQLEAGTNLISEKQVWLLWDT